VPRLEGAADAGAADEEQTKVLRAVHEAIAARGPSAPAPCVRLGPKRALLAAMASVILLLQLWMFSVARSREERSRAAEPAEPARSSERAPALRAAEPHRAPKR
jgi:hypothetical protein